MYIEQISTIHSEVPLLNIRLLNVYILIKNSNRHLEADHTLKIKKKKTGEAYVYVYTHYTNFKKYTFIYLFIKNIRTHTHGDTHVRETHIYIYISYHRFRRAAIRTDRQTHMPMLLTRWIRTPLYCSGDDRRCLPVLDDLVPLNLRVVATLKSTSNGCPRNLCASACACVCVCTCTDRICSKYRINVM